MTEADKSLYREPDEEAYRLAGDLMRTASYASLGVIQPETGSPFVTRVLVACSQDGALALLVSSLSAHSKALAADPRASLLIGEPEKGDPLAHPRLTIQCIARSVDKEEAEHLSMRDLFLSRHPKTTLYIDFGDFHFLRMELVSAHFVAGFGKAFSLTAADLTNRLKAL